VIVWDDPPPNERSPGGSVGACLLQTWFALAARADLMRATSVRNALRERNVRLLFGSGAVDALGNGMANVALAFAVLQIGGAADLGYTFLAREIPMIVFLLLGGVWADRVSRKLLLVLGDLAMGSAQVLTALLFLTHHATVWRVALLQVVFGVANSFTRPASTGLIAQAVSHAHLQEANALLDLSRSLSRVVGPAVGGLIVVAAAPGWALAIDAATFFVAAVFCLQLRISESERPERTNMIHELREGWSEFVSRTWLWSIVAGFGFFQLSLFPALLVLGPLVAKTHLGGAAAWGLILSFQAVGSIVGGLMALRVHPKRPLVAATLLSLPIALVLALLGATAPTALICAVGFVSSVGLTIGEIVWFTTFQRLVPDHLMSRLSSIDWFGSVVLNPIGYALIGPLATHLGVARTLYLAAASNALVTLAIAATPAIRNLRLPEPAAGAVTAN
jgi:predicted MFS family arabinose efflux permease